MLQYFSKHKILIVLFLFFFPALGCLAQYSNKLFPPLSIGESKLACLSNPASIVTGAKLDLLFGQQQPIGVVKNTRVNFACFSFGFPENKKNAIGIRFLGQKNGKYLGQQAVYGMYAWSGKLNNATVLKLGISFGFQNYTIKTDQLDGKGKNMAMDGDFGCIIKTRKYEYGVSVNQVFNSYVQPFLEKYTYPMHVNFSCKRSFEYGNDLKGNISAKYRHLTKNLHNVDFTNSFQITQKVKIGCGYHHRYLRREIAENDVLQKFHKGISFSAGFNQLIIDNGLVSIDVNYYLPILDNPGRFSVAEFTVKFAIQ